MDNPYSFFGLENGASNEDVKRMYRLYASKLHPDKHNGDPFFTEIFKKVTCAYEEIGNSSPDFKIKSSHARQNEEDELKDLQNKYDAIVLENLALKEALVQDQEIALQLKICMDEAMAQVIEARKIVSERSSPDVSLKIVVPIVITMIVMLMLGVMCH